MYTLICRVLLDMRHVMFLRFALIGGVGFVVDGGVFASALYLFSFPLLPARIFAFLCSTTATWLGNRIFTFNQKQGSCFKQWRNFFASACLAAIPNFLVFTLVIYCFGKVGYTPFIALICGVLTGMFFNYTLCSKWVFVK